MHACRSTLEDPTDLADEDVDIYALRGCSGPWELLGTATTTDDDNPPHETIEGADDRGGRVYFEITGADRLALGRHRLLFVVRGDHTLAHAYIEVVPDDTRFVVTDVDGTQTENENAEVAALFGGEDPAHNRSGPELMAEFARRGRHILSDRAARVAAHAHARVARRARLSAGPRAHVDVGDR